MTLNAVIELMQSHNLPLWVLREKNLYAPYDRTKDYSRGQYLVEDEGATMATSIEHLQKTVDILTRQDRNKIFFIDLKEKRKANGGSHITNVEFTVDGYNAHAQQPGSFAGLGGLGNAQQPNPYSPHGFNPYVLGYVPEQEVERRLAAERERVELMHQVKELKNVLEQGISDEKHSIELYRDLIKEAAPIIGSILGKPVPVEAAAPTLGAAKVEIEKDEPAPEPKLTDKQKYYLGLIQGLEKDLNNDADMQEVLKFAALKRKAILKKREEGNNNEN